MLEHFLYISKLRADLSYGHPQIPGRQDKGGFTVCNVHVAFL